MIHPGQIGQSVVEQTGRFTVGHVQVDVGEAGDVCVPRGPFELPDVVQPHPDGISAQAIRYQEYQLVQRL
ncbi:hypothetical protein SDC9_202135 [bioreactor metagenome]|uniref:Uncharacterized protein n=1 Tax=bioreactor metagenome TaxID=1076179 RepID=A0A645IST9_9ZZZZ